jgi:predicted O-linked N-acetylglucosamine transferase (SPINDLY family)
MKMYEKISHPSLVHLISIQNHKFPKIVSTEVAPLIPNTNLNFNVNLNHLPHDITPPQDENEKKRSRLRIVFISSHFGGNEPHGLLLIDVIRRLPSKLFECIAIGVGTKEPSRRFVDAVNGKFYGVGSNDRRARELLQSLKPDCLVFGEVLNEGFLFFLAQTRFAPLQVLVMGAPVTSGFSTIDYFISGDRLEHVSASTNVQEYKSVYEDSLLQLTGL